VSSSDELALSLVACAVAMASLPVGLKLSQIDPQRAKRLLLSAGSRANGSAAHSRSPFVAPEFSQAAGVDLPDCGAAARLGAGAFRRLIMSRLFLLMSAVAVVLVGGQAS